MSLPPELDFDRDREASPARMNRAMEWLYLAIAAAGARVPEFEAAIREIQAIGLERLDEVLGPILIDATDIAARLSTIRDTWLGSEPLMAATAALTAQVTARLAANAGDVAAQLAAHGTAVATQLAAVDTKLGQLSPTATWAEANVAEARVGTASRLLSAAIWWAAQVPVALVDAATIAVPAGINFSVTLRGNRRLALPTELRLGQSGFFRVAQDATGGREFAFAAGYRAGDGAALPVVDPAPGAVTVLRYQVTGEGEVTITGGKSTGSPRQQTFEVCDGPSAFTGAWFEPTEQRVKVRAIGNGILYATSTPDAPTTFGSYDLVGPGNEVTLTIAAGAALRVASFSTGVVAFAHVTRI